MNWLFLWKSHYIPKEEEKPAKPQAPVNEVPAADSLDTLAHPEDKPAPLFAKKAEPAQDLVPPPAPEVAQSVESLDTTMGEAGDSSNSIMMSNTDEHNQQSMEDVQTGPVVGDFLKMQFVEHKVVPTILVSLYILLRHSILTFSGFLFPISLE